MRIQTVILAAIATGAVLSMPAAALDSGTDTPAGTSPPETRQANSEDGQSGDPEPTSRKREDQIEPPSELATVRVLGRPNTLLVPDAVTRRIGRIDENPRGISVIPESFVEARQPRRTYDIVTSNASVQPGDDFFATFSVRGFEATRSTNGIAEPPFANNASFNETAHLQRIEVIKGPTAIVLGSVAPGGTINRVTYKPTPMRGASIEVAGGNRDFFEAEADFHGALDAGGNVAGRLIVAYRQQDDFRQFVDSDRAFLAPSMKFALSDRTELLISGFWRDEDNFLDDGLPVLADGSLAGVGLDRNFQEPDDGIGYTSYGTTLALDHQFSANVDGAVSIYWQEDEEDRSSTRFLGDAAPDGTVERFFLDQLQVYDNIGVQADLRARLFMGAIRHEWQIGFDFNETGSDREALVDFAAPINIFDPVFGQPRFGLDLPDALDRDVTTLGGFVQDRMFLFDDRLVINAALRFDSVDLEANQSGAFGDADYDFTRDEVSPSIGAIWRARTGTDYYASYLQSFEAPDPAGGFINPDEFPDPQQGEQWEIGVRQALFDDSVYATLALFDLTKENVVTADPEDPLRSVQIGEQESRGVEFELQGEPINRLLVLASASILDTEVTRDFTGLKGNELANVPETSLSAGVIYRFAGPPLLQGLRIGVNGTFRGERFTDIGNDTELASYARFDAFASWKIERWKISLHVENAFDREYIQTNTIPGDRRTVIGRIGFEL